MELKIIVVLCIRLPPPMFVSCVRDDVYPIQLYVTQCQWLVEFATITHYLIAML
jgi:hypothetical protein